MASSEKMITLRSSDNETFEVEEAVALVSETIKYMVEDDCGNSIIPVANVTGKILSLVIEYCKKHVESSLLTSTAAEASSSSSSSSSSGGVEKKPSGDKLKQWDAEFVKVDQATVFELILAANYLNIKSLLDLTCQTVADLIKEKSPEEVRQIFNIKNDLTAEEEAEIRKENQWAFE